MELRFPLLPGVTTFAAELTITDTPTLLSDLIAADLAAFGLRADQIDYFLIQPKITAGTDRAAILIGTAADRMFLHYPAGQLAAPPITGDLYLTRVGVDDVDAVAIVSWHP